ncbi:hypothetical protein BDK51DRAFT_53026 [Blyttiomyces helicus]|uniref:Uncharacterized protein n=1 Tax=Blyttiomyces helicus TaxID=388810 RepID=A0A4P9W8I9_9FUNG|nr:hypothetical protein BDK51DRAFT_53026 [Blyttiomyces helicus]|eukprot:RKO86486.1 hypothetical protein BDK51DRAFT_53026 [Blyttiomyces helicus]
MRAARLFILSASTPVLLSSATALSSSAGQPASTPTPLALFGESIQPLPGPQLEASPSSCVLLMIEASDAMDVDHVDLDGLGCACAVARSGPIAMRQIILGYQMIRGSLPVLESVGISRSSKILEVLGICGCEGEGSRGSEGDGARKGQALGDFGPAAAEMRNLVHIDVEKKGEKRKSSWGSDDEASRMEEVSGTFVAALWQTRGRVRVGGVVSFSKKSTTIQLKPRSRDLITSSTSSAEVGDSGRGSPVALQVGNRGAMFAS